MAQGIERVGRSIQMSGFFRTVSRYLPRRRSGRLLLFLMVAVLASFACATLMSCGMTEGLELRRIAFGGDTRSYYLHVPISTDASTGAPLIIALHRFTETGAWMAKMTGFNALADSESFLVAYPNGKSRRFSFRPGADPDDAAFVLAVIEDIAAIHVIDRSRVYLTGASNGGFLVHKLACEHPETFAAAAPVMATFIRESAETCRPGNHMPMMVIHGDADPLVPYSTDSVFAGPGMTLEVLSVPETVAFWAEQNGCLATPVAEALPDIAPGDGTTAVRETYLGEDGLARVVHIKVQQGGHTWPGGWEPWPAFIVGKQNEDFSATRMIWDFFKQHRHEDPLSPEETHVP